MSNSPGSTRFRLWITRYEDWVPDGPCDVPPRAHAVELAEPGVWEMAEAVAYIEAFNRRAMGRPQRLWVVAVPVSVCYEGDLRRGQVVCNALRPDAAETS